MISVIVPYYRNAEMLKIHLRTWNRYPPDVRKQMRLIVVDDGSPEPASRIIGDYNEREEIPNNMELYRIHPDIPWNRGGARNLGATVTKDEWLLHMDIDHVMPVAAAEALAHIAPDLGTWTKPDERWFRFERYRYGRADETRKKDAIDPESTFGKIKPHIDSYLCRRELYWKVGGYDEDYSGCLGGGSPFLSQLERAAPVQLIDAPICLHVYTRSTCPDASDFSLSRDTSEYSRRRIAKERKRDTLAKNPIRFSWGRVL